MGLLLGILLCLTSLAHAEEKKLTSTLASQIQFPVEKYQLANGLTVLLYEDHRSPLISVHQWFRVGSADEKPGRTGIAHFFEHLMFKGTPKFPGKELEQLIQANGGLNNAFTTRDYTGYFEDMPSGKLELILDIESDRLHNLLFDEKEIMNEREVVKEERRFRVENSVFGYLNESIYETVFKISSYRWPVIGYMKDLNATSIADLKEFYRVFYAPNNAVLIVSGDFKSAAAKKMIEKYYGKIPSQGLPERKPVPEPAQRGQRVVNLEKNVQNSTIGMAYEGGPAGSDDSFVLDLIANILGNGPSSRLHKRLVYRAQMANSVGVFSESLHHTGVVQIISSLNPGVDSEKAVQLLNSEIWKIRRELVNLRELEKAKTQVMLDYVNSLKTVSGKARGLALNEILFGDYTQLFKDLDRYNQVTVNQIKDVAEKYLRPEKRSIIYVRPKNVKVGGA